MADQPTPDFSQNQQYAPGFQPQQPIPGISSSFPQQQLSPFQQSPQIAQQADMIAVQSMVNSRTTMAIAQQNLMQSMHTAMLGTMGAFSDMSRRGSSMIMSMSPTGRYNDMLAPNQNWALESSFRREVGYGLGNSMGLDPYNSTFSRLMQGRRPEFLTEGEYGSTMRFAGDIRKDQFMKGLGSIGGSAALSATASVLGLGMGASLAVPMVGGLVIDRMLEANFAEREETLKQQMLAKTKRVGIGQQFISTGDSAQITKTFFEQSNPYGSRFFGDTALGRAFKPDVDKHKIFQDVRDSGLLSFESLNADHVIDYVNKISATVEKFSRIGKVTREVATKIMADMKGSGLHGDDLISTFKQTAYTSSLTGIDMQTLGNVISGTSAQAGASGFNNTHAAQSMNNIISGYAMMQQNGMFKGKNVMDLSQREMSYKTVHWQLTRENSYPKLKLVPLQRQPRF